MILDATDIKFLRKAFFFRKSIYEAKGLEGLVREPYFMTDMNRLNNQGLRLEFKEFSSPVQLTFEIPMENMKTAREFLVKLKTFVNLLEKHSLNYFQQLNREMSSDDIRASVEKYSNSVFGSPYEITPSFV